MLTEYINDRYNINRGGCGIAAILIADKIKAKEFLWLSEEDPRLLKTAPMHCYALKDDVAIDTTGKYKPEEAHRELNSITYRNLKPWKVNRKLVLEIIKNAGWNSMFERKHTTKIATFIGVEIPKDLRKAIGLKIQTTQGSNTFKELIKRVIKKAKRGLYELQNISTKIQKTKKAVR